MSTKRERIEKKVVPPRPIRALATEASQDLSASIATLDQWMGERFAPASRPCAAVEVLDDVAQTLRFTPEQRGDRDAMRALQLALDLRAIARAPQAPCGRLQEVARDVRAGAA